MRERLKQAIKSAEEIGCRCLVCGELFHGTESGLACRNGHTVNVNRKGCFNFLSRPVSGVYDKELFSARHRVLEAGYYDAVVDQIISKIPDDAVVLDAGCGDGYYLKEIRKRRSRCRLAGADISRDAVETAADSQGLWCVADMRRLPFCDNTFDVLLNILSPADYAEFRRVLKPDGILIKVTPGASYLAEIRAMRGMPAGQESAAGEYLSSQMHCIDADRVTETMNIIPEIWESFVRMTPLNQDLMEDERTALYVHPSKTITIDLNILTADFRTE
ncbi:MAG: methyltransferase domain-containing protein [Clostridia bacterium]|nr:methyltransferase domain-containing protein [Clostridia bacterium]